MPRKRKGPGFDDNAREAFQYGVRAHKVLKRMRTGDTLHVNTSHADGVSWWLEPSARTVGPQTARRVLSHPQVVAEGDALFDGLSQTYRYVAAK